MQRLSGPVRFQKKPDGNALYRQMDYQRVSASALYNDDAERGKPSLKKKILTNLNLKCTRIVFFLFFLNIRQHQGIA